MAVSSVQSGYQIIDMSSKMAEEAAHEIQRNQQLQAMPKDNTYDFNQVEFKASPTPSDIDSLTKLTSAEQYSKIGTNVIQRDQEMIGSLLDIHV
ncbi:hypothetical protein TW81_06320 [Vibrio galatheae]|uniref:Flagellar basal-body/hook protein C-terminal domain-containing protein n=1 Tax=Vibrio galatheae TaxID=579748 RepID=A0A0F4NM44_9VIBR|nr:hypothetical protein [Vibrio galatheae]KJY83939.1 hypothetical protein TW81_06320 [Vibrio galatheae]